MYVPGVQPAGSGGYGWLLRAPGGPGAEGGVGYLRDLCTGPLHVQHQRGSLCRQDCTAGCSYPSLLCSPGTEDKQVSNSQKLSLLRTVSVHA